MKTFVLLILAPAGLSWADLLILAADLLILAPAGLSWADLLILAPAGLSWADLLILPRNDDLTTKGKIK